VSQEENLCDLKRQHSDMSDIRHNMHYCWFGSFIFHLRVLCLPVILKWITGAVSVLQLY